MQWSYSENLDSIVTNSSACLNWVIRAPLYEDQLARRAFLGIYSFIDFYTENFLL